MGLLGSVDNAFAYKMLLMAVAILFLMPTFISIYTDVDENEQVQDLLDDYKSFTGTRPTNEAVWCLTGIYTPYSGGSSYGYTDDGWLYGSKVVSYSPSQYQFTNMAYEVTNPSGGENVYRYVNDTSNGNHLSGDLYTSVAWMSIRNHRYSSLHRGRMKKMVSFTMTTRDTGMLSSLWPTTPE